MWEESGRWVTVRLHRVCRSGEVCVRAEQTHNLFPLPAPCTSSHTCKIKGVIFSHPGSKIGLRMGVSHSLYNTLFVTVQGKLSRQSLFLKLAFNQWEVNSIKWQPMEKQGKPMLFCVNFLWATSVVLHLSPALPLSQEPLHVTDSYRNANDHGLTTN